MVQENTRRFGKYDLIQLLGRGATSEVWKAFDPDLKRNVAIKFLHADLRTDPDAVARFVREAQGVASLRHPNIVQVHDLQLSPQNPNDVYMVMDYIEGITLREYIEKTARQHKFLSDTELVRLFSSIALAVDDAHQHGMIHRDIKPANILLDRHNTTRNLMGEPMLADFGLVKIAGISTATQRGMILGTPLYMSPEQAAGEPGNKFSDIYSLGVILYEMCTGVTPFRGDGNYEVLLKHMTKLPQPPRLINPRVSEAVQEVILRSLAKEPEHRFLSASALVVALARALSVPLPHELASYTTEAEKTPRRPVQAKDSRPPVQQAPAKNGYAPITPLPPTSPDKKAAYAPVVTAPTPSTSPTLPTSPTPATPNPVTPVPTVDAIATLKSTQPSSSLPHPHIVTRSSFKTPKMPKSQNAALWNKKRTFIIVAVLLLLALISGLTWAILPKFQQGTAVAGATSVGNVSFYSTGTLIFNAVDQQYEHAINDGLQGILHLAPPASGDSYYAWLRSSYTDTSGLLLNPPGDPNDTLMTKNGVGVLTYVDEQHRNLLGPKVADGDSYKVFTIGEQKTTSSPVLDRIEVRYTATITANISKNDIGTYLQHIQHLLSSDPDMDTIGLTNGLDYWFLKNVNVLYTLVSDIESHSSPQSLSMVQEWTITSVYYLDGNCAAEDIHKVNSSLNSHQQPYTLHDTQVSLLNCIQTPFELGYIYHMSSHLMNIEHTAGVTATQISQIDQILNNLAQVNQWLQNILNDALKLIPIPVAKLGSLAALQLRYDMATNARLALSGQVNPETKQIEPGASLICDSIQQLANMSVTAA